MSVTPMVAIVMDNMHSYQKYVCKSIDNVLRNSGVRTLKVVLTESDIVRADNGAQSGFTPFDYLNKRQISGVVALTSSVGALMEAGNFFNLVESITDIPVVHLGVIEGRDAVGLDNAPSMRALLDNLTKKAGCKKLCFVRGFGQYSDSAQREKAFVQYLVDNDLPLDPDFIVNGNFREAHAHSAIINLLENGKIPDAIVAANDHMAVAAMRAVQSFGLRVPEDVCISGFDDRSIATECTPPLTTVRVDLDNYARQAAERILCRLQAAVPGELATDTLLEQREQSSYSSKYSDHDRNACRLILRASTARGSRDPLTNENAPNQRDSESEYTIAIMEVLRILEDEEHKRLNSVTGVYFNAFMQTLVDNTDAFEAVVDELDGFADIEFDEHNVLRELYYAITDVLLSVSKMSVMKNGFFKLTSLSYKISTLVYDAKAKELHRNARSQQHYNLFQSTMLQCREISCLTSTLDSAFDLISVDTAYLVLNKKVFVEQLSSGNESIDSLRELVYLRSAGKRQIVVDPAIDGDRLLPEKFDHIEINQNLLVLPLLGYGYLIFDITFFDSTFTESLASCITASLNNCIQHRSQKLQAEQLRTLNAELAHKINFDSVTGLPNRRQYLVQLEQAISENNKDSSRFALLQLQFNDQTRINLQYGPEFFDYLVRSVAMKFSSLADEGCAVFHTDTCEFSILVKNASEPGIKEKIESLLDELNQPIMLAGSAMTISYNAGTAIYPQHGFNANELISSATTALESTNVAGSGKHRVFDLSLHKSGTDKWNLDKQMRQAFADNEFCLYYQPRIDLESGRIASFEALIRWFDDANENQQKYTPDVFIPVAEETGFIVELGEFVLNTACAQLKIWQEAGLDSMLSVNLSTRELEEKNLVERIVNTMNSNCLDSHSIEIEITESAALGNIESSVSILGDLRDRGISIAIDDFGTEYSSLNYLKRLPANCLKVDRSFLREIEHADGGNSADAAIVRAIVTLGHSLGHLIVAEGVETIEQLKFLTSLGVQQVQGYYYSPPISSVAAEQLLREGNQLDIKAA